MQKNLTELVFILDKSGSMSGLERDTIGGYNSMLAKQKEVVGEAIVTTVLFDDKYEILHDRLNIKSVKSITESEYFVGGTTALLDAIGKTMDKIGNDLSNTDENFRPEKVIFVIITDGEENASQKFSSDEIKAKIEHQKYKYNWEFIFLGANIDAVETAEKIGISAERGINYVADSIGTELNFKVMNEAIISFREVGEIKEECFEVIREDVKKRKKI